MSARAYVQDDWVRDGIKLGLVLRSREDSADVMQWGFVTVTSVEDNGAEPGEDFWLHLPQDAGRALYEALARHYGGISVDAASLRKDYDAERKRVDTFIAHLTAVTS